MAVMFFMIAVLSGMVQERGRNISAYQFTSIYEQINVSLPTTRFKKLFYSQRSLKRIATHRNTQLLLPMPLPINENGKVGLHAAYG